MRRTPTGLIAGLSLLLVVAAVATGCRQGSFLGNRYSNFRAYYNTFYNARKAFEEGEEQLVRLDERIDRSRFLPVFADVPAEAAAPRGGATGGPFQNAIDKSADLLRERPGSKWADDALLLIGRSYFYQRNLVGAEAKFRETIAAAEEREQGELADEARYWLGRTLAAQERYDEAASVIEEGLARDGLSRRWRARMQLALAEQYVQQRHWSAAAEALRAGLADLRDADLAGRASFLLGQVLEADGDYDGAADAYGAVERNRPYYELLYASQLSRARVLGIDAGRHDEALTLIRRMRRDDKNFQNRAEVELTYARLLAAAGRHGEARDRFEALLYDYEEGEEFAGTSIPRDEVHYYYGAFHRDQLNDYVRAAAYLDTAATGLRTDPGREALLTRAALTGVRREADAFLDYADIATRLTEADSLLELGVLSDEAFAARRAEIEAAQRRAWEEEQRRLAALRARQGFQGAAAAVPGSGIEGTPPPGGSATPPAGAADAGFLGYRDVARLQDALVSFQAVWGDRPLVPNWRRRQAIGGAVVDDQMDVVGTQGALPQGRSPGGPPPLDWANVPRTPERRAILLTERASLRYELGNVLFLSLAEPDSAAYWYRLVLDENADAPVAPRAIYALGEVRREQGHTEEAEALYRRLLEVAPESALAATARERLGLPAPERDTRAEVSDRAAAAYEEAYARWRRGEHDEAIRGFLDLAVTYDETEQAPRALLAAAEAFAEWVQRDRLDLEDGIPADLVPPALLDSLETLVPAPAPPPEPLEGDPPAPAGGEEEEVLEQLQGEAGPPKNVAPPPAPLEEDEPSEAPDPLAEPEDEKHEDAPAAVGAEALQAENEPLPVAEVEPIEEADLAVPDETLMPEEVTPADTIVADSTAADSTAATPALRMMDLLAFVEAWYPETPYAARAQAHRSALLALNAPEDVPVADSLAAPVDPYGPPLDEAIVAAAPPGTFGLEGELPLAPEIGGYTWRVAAVSEPRVADGLLRRYLRQRLRAAVLQEQGVGTLFVVLVGQFASGADAEAARDDLPETGTEGGPSIVPLAGLALLDPDELARLADPR